MVILKQTVILPGGVTTEEGEADAASAEGPSDKNRKRDVSLAVFNSKIRSTRPFSYFLDRPSLRMTIGFYSQATFSTPGNLIKFTSTSGLQEHMVMDTPAQPSMAGI